MKLITLVSYATLATSVSLAPASAAAQWYCATDKNAVVSVLAGTGLIDLFTFSPPGTSSPTESVWYLQIGYPSTGIVQIDATMNTGVQGAYIGGSQGLVLRHLTRDGNITDGKQCPKP